jgi:uncharacterized protein YndB with AHSA1/START domain
VAGNRACLFKTYIFKTKIFKMATQLPLLQIKTSIHIAKGRQEVFEAIADPEKMSHYFIAKSSGPMRDGSTVQWTFPEMDASFPVQVKTAVPAEKIEFSWRGVDGTETTVRIELKPVSEAITYVNITEGEKEATEGGIKWLKENTEGWANFLACLKAYLEYGINLRKGAFKPLSVPEKDK